MHNLVYLCFGVCVLVAMSSAVKPGGNTSGNMVQFRICEDLVAQQNETLQLLQEFPCFDDVSYSENSIDLLIVSIELRTYMFIAFSVQRKEHGAI